jgi:outer membrane protein assembly factor BamA
MSFRRVASIVCTSFLFAGLSAVGQTYTAGKFVFNTPGPYANEQLEAAIQMHPGTKFTAEDLAAAAQRLVDTGYFDDVTASLDGRVNAITVNFFLKPTPREHMLHVGFENFIWLTNDEIEAAIKVKSPLFLDYLPEGSAIQDTLKAALSEALTAKGVPASVVYQTVEPTLRHPVREIEFRVAKPYIRVTNVKLAGVSPELVTYVQKSVDSTARTQYRVTPEGYTTADQILAPLFDAGYVQASLSDVTATPSAMADGGIGMVVSATLNAGEVYRVSGLTFAGAPLLSSEDFAAGAKLHPGDIATRKALLETLAPLDAAYRQQGYMDNTIVAKPTFDEAKHQVAYVVSYSTGEQYRLKELTVNNLDPAAKSTFDRIFSMKAGELYNPEYVASFLGQHTARAAIAGYTGNYTAYAHPMTHTVDLVINYVPRSQ